MLASIAPVLTTITMGKGGKVSTILERMMVDDTRKDEMAGARLGSEMCVGPIGKGVWVDEYDSFIANG